MNHLPTLRFQPALNSAYRRAIAAAASAAFLLSATALAQVTGPSSSQAPYLVPLTSNVQFTSLLTTGDSINSYRMSGVPDGLGAYDNGNGTITVLVGHELTPTYTFGGNTLTTTTRAHGGNGAFISEWIIDKTTLSVTSGADLMQKVYSYNGTGWDQVTGAANLSFNRFCSADLAAPSAFYDSASGLGTTARIFLNGEENGNGRGLAHVATGTDKGSTYVLPWAAPSATASQQQSWENLLANPNSGAKTLVIGNSDGGNNGLVVYVGNKSNSGTDIEKAGLVGGQIYRVSVNSNAAENRNADAGLALVNKSGTFSLVGGTTGVSSRGTGTSFLRPEDGAWDTINPNRYYFVTTDRMDAAKDGNANADIPANQAGRSRLWSLTFSDLAHPENGGTIDLLLDGTTAQGNYQMFDNLTVNADGSLFLQEDVGNNLHNGKIWGYNPATGGLTLIAGHDTALFGDLNITATITKDEESSGIIDITALLGRNDGKTYSLLDVQNHALTADTTLMEGGQLLLMTSAVPEAQTYGLWLVGACVSWHLIRRRRANA